MLNAILLVGYFCAGSSHGLTCPLGGPLLSVTGADPFTFPRCLIFIVFVRLVGSPGDDSTAALGIRGISLLGVDCVVCSVGIVVLPS